MEPVLDQLLSLFPRLMEQQMVKHYIAVQTSCFETSGDDYGDPHPTMLEFEVGITTVCSSILTVDDETYEDSESFSVVLHSANESIVIAVSSATVSITNDDRELETLQNVVSLSISSVTGSTGVRVAWNQTQYFVDEGTTANMCAVRVDPADAAFTVEISSPASDGNTIVQLSMFH